MEPKTRRIAFVLLILSLALLPAAGRQRLAALSGVSPGATRPESCAAAATSAKVKTGGDAHTSGAERREVTNLLLALGVRSADAEADELAGRSPQVARDCHWAVEAEQPQGRPDAQANDKSARPESCPKLERSADEQSSETDAPGAAVAVVDYCGRAAFGKEFGVTGATN